MTTHHKHIPALRFKEFNDPWERKKLETITEKVNSGKTPLGGESVYVDYGILFIRSQNVLDSKLSLENSTYISDEVNNAMRNSVVKPQDILLNITGASLGRSCVVPHDFTIGNVNQHVCIVRLDKENDPYFLQPIFASEKGQNLFTSLQTGSGREGLNFQSIKNLSLFIPALPEQQKIASFLSATDAKIQQLSRKKELLEQYKKGVMQQLFSGKLRFKDENGKAYPNWETKKLGEVINNQSAKYNPDKESKSHKCIELEHLSPNTGSLLGFVDSSSSASIKNKFDKGDVLFGKLRPYLRKFIVAPFDGVCSSEIWVLKGIGILNDFLFRVVQTEYFIELANQSTGSKMPRADWAVVAAGNIDIPSIHEQQKIASYLSSLDTKIEIVTTQINQIQTFKKGLLQQMFV